MVPSSYWGNYQGAAWSTNRGPIQWSTIDEREELSTFERGELLRRIHFLKAHFGLVRGLIKNTADLVGWQKPQAASGDEEWDALAEERFRDVCGMAEAFDVAGKFDVEDAQLMLLRGAFTDGHVFTVLTKWKETGAARFMFYAASQLRNPPKGGPEWRDGIKVSKAGRHLAYGFKNGDGKGDDAVTVIPASAVIYFGEFDSPGQDAPVPPLAHAVNHSADITEVWGFVKKAIKQTTINGMLLEREVGAQPSKSRQGMAGTPQTVTTADGDRIQYDKVIDGGQIPQLDPGVKARILTDNRPSPEQRQFTQDLIRDIATGFGLAPEVVWEMGRMTGPGIRFVMDHTDRWVKCRQKRVRKWLLKVWSYTIACEIAAGRLGLPKAKNGRKGRWYQIRTTCLRSLTIDRGKESKARIDEIEAGVGTWQSWEELDGEDWKDRMRQRVREVRAAMAECGITDPTPEQLYLAVFPPRQGSAAAANVEEAKEPEKGED